MSKIKKDHRGQTGGQRTAQSNGVISDAHYTTPTTPNGTHPNGGLGSVESLLDGNVHEPKNPRRIFKRHSLSDLLARPPKKWLIDALFGIGDIGMIYGAPGSGKTFVVIDLALSASLGKQFAMRFDVDRPLNVAYCAGEGLSGLPARFAAAAAAHGVEELSSFSFFDVVPQLYYSDTEGEAEETIARFVSDWQTMQSTGEVEALDLLVIDTFHSATADGEENSTRDMGRVLKLIKSTVRHLGCSVLVVHHTNKAGTGERGSSSLRGAMDFMVEIKESNGKFAMGCEKLKDGERWKPQTFDLVEKENSVRVWWDEPKDPITEGKSYLREQIISILSDRPGHRFRSKDLNEVVDAKPATLSNMLRRMSEGGEISRGLFDASKEPSNRNPWVYSVENSPLP